MSGGLSNGALPGSRRTTVGPIRRGGAPDRGERLLHRILGAAAIAKPPQRETEHGPCEAPVELLERLAAALAGRRINPSSLNLSAEPTAAPR
jgi:hypothetical protein